MNIISDREIRNLQRDREAKRNERKEQVEFPSLLYRLSYESAKCNQPLSPSLEKLLAPNWYFVCEWLEKRKYDGFLNKMEGKKWHGVDVGGLVGIWDTGEGALDLPPMYHQDGVEENMQKRFAWLKTRIISPFYAFSAQFDQNKTILLLKFPREWRRLMYEQFYGAHWLYSMLAKHPIKQQQISYQANLDGDEDMEQLVKNLQQNEQNLIKNNLEMKKRITSSYICIGAWSRRHEKEKEDMMTEKLIGIEVAHPVHLLQFGFLKGIPVHRNFIAAIDAFRKLGPEQFQELRVFRARLPTRPDDPLSDWVCKKDIELLGSKKQLKEKTRMDLEE